MFWTPFLWVCALVWWFGQVCSFDFIVSPPAQCGSARFTWVGGTPPFYALIIPPGGTIRNISVPTNAWNDKDQSGDFSTLLALSEKQQVAFSMGDATGVTAGGVTDIMTVGPPSAKGQGCNTTDPGRDFASGRKGTLSQCGLYRFVLYANSSAIQPIKILVTVPHGESFLLRPPIGDSFHWQTNLTAGTSVIFTVSDSLDRTGGTSPLLTVGSSDDSFCIRPLPSSALPTRLPIPTSFPLPVITGVGGLGNQDGGTNSNIGIIISAAVGGGVTFLLTVILIYFFAKRKSTRTGSWTGRKRLDSTAQGRDSLSYLLSPGRLQNPPISPFPLNDNSLTHHAGVAPAMLYDHDVSTDSAADDTGDATGAGAQTYQQYQPPPVPVPGTKLWEATIARLRRQQQQQQQQPHQRSRNPFKARAALPTATRSRTSEGPSVVTSARSREASNPAPVPRVIIHMDIEDEPIELPPVYSESRAPISGMAPVDPPASREGM